MSDTVTNQEVGMVAYTPSDSTYLATALVQFGTNFHEAARQSILGTVGPNDGYTQTEIEAMIALEELRLVGSMDLYGILYRGRLIQDIEERGLWSRHPNGYQTLEEAAKAQGLSASEYSNIRDLTQVIFPFIEAELGMSIAELWQNIGKSNFRELVPALKMLITGQDAASPQTRASVRADLEEAQATLAAQAEQTGSDAPTPEAVRNQVISDLLLAGEQMTNRDLRSRTRGGNRTTSIQPAAIRSGERIHFVVTLDNDQYQALLRKLGNFTEEPLAVSLPNDPAMRQREALRVRSLRDLFNLINGA